ncbi:MAG: hypothetical protein MI922_20595, partial [Bacteroidales bacterium]|nr:hypothetical protein [Bacteroidales bacterium]
MKKINPLFLVAIFALVLSVPNTFAADLIVEEGGISPTYSNIQSAIDAASDGDRIFIKNRAGDIPWLEDLSIDKSITLLSFVNDTFFVVQGDITISSATNREVRIVGMRNTDGEINALGNLGDDWSTRLYIMDCFLENGRILTSNNKFYADIVGNTVNNGNISTDYANILGNEITNGTITISGNAAYTGDTVYIVGNKIYNLSSSYGGMNGIFVTCDAFDYEIRNNLVNSTRGVHVSEGNGSQSINIINNTCRTYESTGSGSEYAARGIIIGYTSNNVYSKVELVNNVLDFNETSLDAEYGIELINASDVRVYHNYIDASFDNKI